MSSQQAAECAQLMAYSYFQNNPEKHTPSAEARYIRQLTEAFRNNHKKPVLAFPPLP